MKLRDKLWIVTGAGGGIGRELVLSLVKRGARVAAVDIDASRLSDTAAISDAAFGSLGTFIVNVADRLAVQSLPDQIMAKMGVVDGLINNAGIIQPFVKIEELTSEVIDRVMAVNFFGTLHMTRSFLPHLRARPEAHLVNVASMGAFVPIPGQVLYGASKAAVKLLTEGLASELTGTAVKVTLVLPGAVRTNITTNSGVQTLARSASSQKRMRVLEPNAAADIILDGIERDRSRVFVGMDSRIMDLLARLNPAGAARLIQRKMSSVLAK